MSTYFTSNLYLYMWINIDLFGYPFNFRICIHNYLWYMDKIKDVSSTWALARKKKKGKKKNFSFFLTYLICPFFCAEDSIVREGSIALSSFPLALSDLGHAESTPPPLLSLDSISDGGRPARLTGLGIDQLCWSVADWGDFFSTLSRATCHHPLTFLSRRHFADLVFLLPHEKKWDLGCL